MVCYVANKSDVRMIVGIIHQKQEATCILVDTGFNWPELNSE